MTEYKNRKKVKSYEMDMLHGKVAGKLILFAIPIALSGLLQQLFNSADMVVVGQFAGSTAFAAVGANVANVGIFVNLLSGLAVGVNVVIANFIGQGNRDQVKKIVQSAIFMAVVCGIGISLIGQLIIQPVMNISNVPETVFPQAMIYIRIYMATLPFILIYDIGSAILRSIGDTKRPLYCLTLAGLLNVCLNLLFVIVFKLGVTGVALATLISNIVSCILVIGILLKENSIIHLDINTFSVSKTHIKHMLIIGVPAGIQGMVFSLSNMFIQSGINSFGEAAIAGSSAALNFEYYAYSIPSAFGQATVSFVGQNYGAGDEKRCNKVFWIAGIEGTLFTQVLCTIFTIWAPSFASIFSADPDILHYAIIRMMTVMALNAIMGFYEISASALRGIGISLLPTLVTICTTVVLRLIWMYTAFTAHHTYQMLLSVYPISWILTIALLMPMWFICSKKKFAKLKRTE